MSEKIVQLNEDVIKGQIKEFTQVIENYMVWYREKRIKHSLGGRSPLEYRQNLGLCA